MALGLRSEPGEPIIVTYNGERLEIWWSWHRSPHAPPGAPRQVHLFFNGPRSFDVERTSMKKGKDGQLRNRLS